MVRDKQVEVQRHDYTQASPFKLDYRLFAKSRREAMAKELASSLLENIVIGTTLELGTVQALLAEVQLRVPVPQESLVVEPTISHLLSEDLGEDVVSGAHQCEQQHWKEKLEAAEHIFVAVHSEHPSHYAYLEIHKNSSGNIIEFRDALQNASQSARDAATRILHRLEVIGKEDECPPRCNQAFQQDGWSCGLWVARWFERSLRELAGQARIVPFSLKDLTVRGNEFIKKIKDVGIEPKPKAKPEPKPDKLYKSVEPVFATFEEALEAAKKCTKCLPTKFGTKGCRACMGEHFEQIRIKRTPAQCTGPSSSTE